MKQVKEIGKVELIEKLKILQKKVDKEVAHIEADSLLLQYINDEDVTEAFEDINKWYA